MKILITGKDSGVAHYAARLIVKASPGATVTNPRPTLYVVEHIPSANVLRKVRRLPSTVTVEVCP